jgi:CRP-like cAMP-binding protein
MKNNHRANAHGQLDPSLLRHLPPFSKLDTEQISDILDQAVSVRYDEGATIFHEGQHAERFYMLLDGYIRVVRLSPQGERVIALHIPSGQLFGITGAFGRDTYPATAVAAVEGIALSWPSHQWDNFSATYDGFASETFKVVGHRIAEMSERIIELATQQVQQRIANALLRLVNQTGRKVSTGIVIDFPITRRDLAEMTGATLHTVSRTLSGWEKEGIIASERKRITVCQAHALVVLSGGKVEE